MSYVDAAPGPLEHMIEDTEAIVFVKEMSVYMKVPFVQNTSVGRGGQNTSLQSACATPSMNCYVAV